MLNSKLTESADRLMALRHENEALRTELAEAEAEQERLRLLVPTTAQAMAYQDLLMKYETLCADKVRMDWLCSLTSVIGYWYGHKKFDTRTPDGLIPLRPAIDAAKGNKP